MTDEVLEVQEPYKLVYTWESVGERTTVTWILKKGSDGSSQLHFEQSGFSEETKAYEGAWRMPKKRGCTLADGWKK